MQTEATNRVYQCNEATIERPREQFETLLPLSQCEQACGFKIEYRVVVDPAMLNVVDLHGDQYANHSQQPGQPIGR
jgi:hypothetical protein